MGLIRPLWSLKEPSWSPYKAVMELYGALKALMEPYGALMEPLWTQQHSLVGGGSL